MQIWNSWAYLYFFGIIDLIIGLIVGFDIESCEARLPPQLVPTSKAVLSEFVPLCRIAVQVPLEL